MSRVLILQGSPKKRLSNSAYFAGLLKGNLGGDARRMKLKKTNYDQIFEEFEEIEALVLALPVYVDAIPSHVLEFLQEAERVCREKGCQFQVYGLTNCGFYEGRQCCNALAVLECWCERAGLTFSGGVGIGAGEMLGCIRIIPLLVGLWLGIALLWALIRWAATGSWSLPTGQLSFWLGPLISLSLFLFFNLGLAVVLIRLGHWIRKGKKRGLRFTTVICPRFLFVLFANLFWVIWAAFHRVPVWRMYEGSGNE